MEKIIYQDQKIEIISKAKEEWKFRRENGFCVYELQTFYVHDTKITIQKNIYQTGTLQDARLHIEEITRGVQYPPRYRILNNWLNEYEPYNGHDDPFNAY